MRIRRPREATLDELGEVARQIALANHYYSEVQYLSKGGFAYAFSALYTGTSGTSGLPIRVVIKIPKSDLLPDAFKASGDIVSEGFKVAGLGPHDNIVPVIELLQYRPQDPSRRGLVMKFMDGGSLRKLIETGQLTGNVVESVRIAIGACSALQAAHEHWLPLVHRDVKPENILMDSDGNPRLADFGIAVPPSRLEELLGAVRYIAPECQTEGYQVDRRSDLFALAVVLYEMLEGHTPFNGMGTTDILRQIRSTDPAAMTQDIPRALSRIVSKGLQKDPNKRYQSAAEMLWDLKTFLAFHERIFAVIDRALDDLRSDFQRSGDEDEAARTFVYFAERCLDIASEELEFNVHRLKPGAYRSALELRARVLGELAEDRTSADEISRKVGEICAGTVTIPPDPPAPPAPPSGPSLVDTPEILTVRGLLGEGKILEAERVARRFLATGNSADMHVRVSEAFYLGGLSNLTVDLCREGLALHGEHADLLAIQGLASWQKATSDSDTGLRTEALRLLRRAMELGTNIAEARNICCPSP